MFRSAPRLIARTSTIRVLPRAAPKRRFISTAPPTQKSRSWKSSAARWGIAAGIIYYCQKSDVFAEEPAYTVQQIPETDHEAEQLPTVEMLAAERQKRKAALAEEAARAEGGAAQGSAQVGESMEDLEEDAGQQGAFNPETGEINWDCPCLGGMAYGPCGEEFRAAFSCFIYSTEEPKGMDCIEKFKGMQNCFREHPDVYGAELEADEDDDVTADEDGAAPAPTHATEAAPTAQPESIQKQETDTGRANAVTEQVKKEHEPLSESDEIVPKAWHDETASNEEKKV